MNKRIKFVLGIFVILSVLIITGCNDMAEPASSDQGSGDQAVEQVGDEIKVIDQLGREVSFSTTPNRIISLSPSNTEVAFALGLGDRLVGVTEYCNYPPEAQDREIVGGFSTPNIERIVELAPDLVIASTIHEEDLPRMEELGLSVLVIESATLDDLFTSIEIVAEVTGVPENGASLIASIQERVDAVKAVVEGISDEERVKVYYEVYSDPLMSAGRNAFVNEIISMAGGINIFGEIEENYPQISAEVVAERQPDIILYPDFHGTADLMIEAMMARPGWENIPAIVNSDVYGITDDSFARPGPRVVEAVEEAAEIFYPHLYQ